MSVRPIDTVLIDAGRLTVWRCITSPRIAMQIIGELRQIVRALSKENDLLQVRLSSAKMRNFWTGRNMEN